MRRSRTSRVCCSSSFTFFFSQSLEISAKDLGHSQRLHSWFRINHLHGCPFLFFMNAHVHTLSMNIAYFKNNRFRGHSHTHTPSREIHDSVRAPLNQRETQTDRERWMSMMADKHGENMRE